MDVVIPFSSLPATHFVIITIIMTTIFTYNNYYAESSVTKVISKENGRIFSEILSRLLTVIYFLS